MHVSVCVCVCVCAFAFFCSEVDTQIALISEASVGSPATAPDMAVASSDGLLTKASIFLLALAGCDGGESLRR